MANSLDQHGIDLRALREHGFSNLPPTQQRRLVQAGELDEAAGVPPTAAKAYKVNDLVGLDPELSSPRFRNVVFKVVKVNQVTYKLQPLAGGRLVNADKLLVIDPPCNTSTAVQYPTAETVPLVEHLAAGTLVRVGRLTKPSSWLHEGDLAVVLADKGERVNVAKLGGFEDRYARLPHRALTVMDPASVLNEKPF